MPFIGDYFWSLGKKIEDEEQFLILYLD